VNWLFVYYIVEFEQNGEDRAQYKSRLLKRRSDDLRGYGRSGQFRVETEKLPPVLRSLSVGAPDSVWRIDNQAAAGKNHASESGADADVRRLF